MERLGLVASIEADLERTIGAEGLPEDRGLPSEAELARRYGVCRTTIREALRRLAARGLVVQHPGRRTRVVALGEALTLENLAVALHDGPHAPPERRRLLLEGYFALKREALVELLAACREHASARELRELSQACFALRDAARWEEPWVEREFELLRLAAQVARRPGHLLLILSLERAWRGIQARVRPHLEAQAVRQWAECAMKGLDELEPPALKRELLPLLLACDERVLERFAPVHEAHATPQEQHRAASAPLPHAETEPARAALAEPVCANRSVCQTGSCAMTPQESSPPGAAPTRSCPSPECEWPDAHGPAPGVRRECACACARMQAPAAAPAGATPGRVLSIHLDLHSCRRVLREGEHAAPTAPGTWVEHSGREEHTWRPPPLGNALPDC